eukprot:5271312-Prymnesium_polylepis.1
MQTLGAVRRAKQAPCDTTGCEKPGAGSEKAPIQRGAHGLGGGGVGLVHRLRNGGCPDAPRVTCSHKKTRSTTTWQECDRGVTSAA